VDWQGERHGEEEMDKREPMIGFAKLDPRGVFLTCGAIIGQTIPSKLL
jgi:hypothetical protein